MAINMSSVLGGIAGGATVAITIKAIDAYSKELRTAETSMHRFSSAAKTLGLAAAGGMALFAKSSINAAAKVEKALIGLQTVARATGNNLDETTEAAQRLADDGLLSIAEASEGLKNLLATGFSLPEAINLMTTFKDAAAFNRQGMLAFGQAVVGATQGVKNQNSIMVDNVGITKNLSLILKEAGFQLQDLGDSTKSAAARQALFNGLMKEGELFAGDAARATETYEGQVSRLNQEMFMLRAEVGEDLLPVMRDLVGEILDNKDAIVALAEGVGWLVKLFLKAVEGAVWFAETMGNSVGAIVEFVDLVGQGVNGLDAWNVVSEKMIRVQQDGAEAWTFNNQKVKENSTLMKQNSAVSGQMQQTEQKLIGTENKETKALQKQNKQLQTNLTLRQDIAATMGSGRSFRPSVEIKNSVLSAGRDSQGRFVVNTGGLFAPDKSGNVNIFNKSLANLSGVGDKRSGARFSSSRSSGGGSRTFSGLGGIAGRNDAAMFMTNTGQLFEFSPQDNISLMANKSGKGMGGGTTVNVVVQGSIWSLDDLTDQIDRKLSDKLFNRVSVLG